MIRPDSSAERLGVTLGHLATRRPRATMAICTLVCLLFGLGLVHARFSTDYRIFFSPEDPHLASFESLERVFTKTDNVVLVVRARDGDLLSSSHLSALRELTKQAWQIPFASRVDSLANFQVLEAEDDDLLVEDLIPRGDLSKASIDTITRRIDAEPLLRGSLLSQDGRTAGIHVTLRLPRQRPDEVVDVADAARALAHAFETEHPGLETRASGMALMNHAFMEASVEDMSIIVPLMYLLMIVAMTLLLRSAAATAGVVIVVVLSSLVTMGLSGWLRYPLTPPSASAPTIVLTLAVADGVHIFHSVRRGLADGLGVRPALINALRVNLRPVVLTSLTTIVGFLCLNFSEAPPYAHLANMTAAGILAALVLSVTFFPAFLSCFRLETAARSTSGGTSFARLSALVTGRPTAFLAVGTVLTIVFAVSAARLRTNDRFIEYFDDSITFRPDTEFMMEHLTGVYTLEILVSGGAEGAISDPRVLAAISEQVEWLRAQPEILHVHAYTDLLRRISRTLDGRDALPNSRALASQYLLLYEMSLPAGLSLNDRLDVSRSATRVSLTVDDLSSREFQALQLRIEERFRTAAAGVLTARVTSPVLIFSYLADRNTEAMLGGNLVSLLLISLCLLLALWSVRLGLLSIIPNLLPILFGYGLWSLLFSEINIVASIAGTVCLGIIVDDTIHFLSKYQLARRERSGPVPALRETIESVGPAVVITTLVLLVGFGVLTQSGFQMNRYLGLLTTMVVLFALIADLLFLPPLILMVEGLRGRTVADYPGASSVNTKPTALVALFIGGAALAAPRSLAAELRLDVDARAKPHVEKIRAQTTGYGDMKVRLQMILRDEEGRESRRSMRLRSLAPADPEDGDRSLVIFDSPADVKGTALLSHTQIEAEDRQWLYLPAARRTRRISGGRRSGAFLGSEFSYEDITANEVSKYAWRYLESATCPGRDSTCHKLETSPKDDTSGYSKRVLWVDGESRILRIEFFDPRGALLKTLTYSDYRKYEGKFWRAHRWTMKNAQSGKSTQLSFDTFHFSTGLGPSDFTKTALTRIR